MPFTIHVDVVSAEEKIYSGIAEKVFAPARMGEVGIVPHHAPMLTLMRPGDVRILESGGKTVSFFVSGGILEVQPHGVIVLSDTVLRAEDIDVKEAKEAKRRAEDALAGKQVKLDPAQAQAQLNEAIAKLRVVRLMREASGEKY